MKTTSSIRLCHCLVAFLVFFSFLALAEPVALLHTKTESYQNVTIISRTATHAFVQHSKGVASIKLTELDAEGLSALGINGAESAVALAPKRSERLSAAAGPTPTSAGKTVAAISDWVKNFSAQVRARTGGQSGSGGG